MAASNVALRAELSEKGLQRRKAAGPPELYAPNFKESSFWLDEPGDLPAPCDSLPEKVDVAVIGSGYTGLSAALQTARGGRSTLVLEAGPLGNGCSTRNGAHISTSVKPGFELLAKRFGSERARAIRMEGHAALAWIQDFIESEGIRCDFRRSGRFHAAHSPSAYERIARSAERLREEEGLESYSVSRSEQRSELGSDFYHGGVVYPSFATLHPVKYHRAILGKAAEAGALFAENCAALSIERESQGFLLKTAKGDLRARDVIVATNGYTGPLTPWLRRRVIPIGSYIIATEALPSGSVERLFPSNRIVSDTRRVVYYYGPSPDGRSVLFGGRVSADETDPKVSGPRLRREMLRIFPTLESARLSHSWHGFVAYTFDELAHCGTHDGIHYAMGYCGSGVSMAGYLGMRIGQRVLGLAEGRTAFDDLPFPTRPLYSGRPWFLPAAVAWYGFLDDLECRLAARSSETV